VKLARQKHEQQQQRKTILFEIIYGFFASLFLSRKEILSC
jgi:hypothetical protein